MQKEPLLYDKHKDRAISVAGRKLEMTEPNIVITELGGNCPVQAEGTVNGKPFYFRARGGHWSMSIGGEDVVGGPDWYYEEEYGDWPEAGWMTVEEAEAFLRQAANAYVNQS